MCPWSQIRKGGGWAHCFKAPLLTILCLWIRLPINKILMKEKIKEGKGLGYWFSLMEYSKNTLLQNSPNLTISPLKWYYMFRDNLWCLDAFQTNFRISACDIKVLHRVPNFSNTCYCLITSADISVWTLSSKSHWPKEECSVGNWRPGVSHVCAHSWVLGGPPTSPSYDCSEHRVPALLRVQWWAVKILSQTNWLKREV